MTDKPTVIQALAEVMGDVQAVRKDSRNAQQNFNFRGIDAVMNAVGPALRKHGVVIVPIDVVPHYRDAMTTTGKPAREVTLVATYQVYGPAGDSILIQAPGESLDSGDKGTPKAMSVAYRTALLQALTIPTDEPDPDSQTYERAAAAPPMPAELDVQKARVWQLAKTRWGSLGEAAAASALKDYAAGQGIDLGDPVQLRQLADQWAQDAASTAPAQGRKASDAQITKLHTVFSELGVTDRAAKLARVGAILGREVDTTKTLTAREAATVIDRLENGEGGEQHG